MEEDNVVESKPDMLKTDRTCTDVSTVSPAGIENVTQKFQTVINVIKKDMVAADLKWSLFVAASQSYKHDSCLRPFPSIFLVDGNKDFTALMAAVESVPAFLQLETLSEALPKVAIDLLYWVLVELKEPSLSVVNKTEIDDVLELVSYELSAPPPSVVLRVSYDPSSANEQKWTAAKQQYSTIHAFHGSKVENFHSIIQHGLQQHLTKNALFGQGVYLSSELLVSLPYSRNGFGWSKSSLGQELSIVAFCEVVDHPCVICQNKDDYENRSRARPEDSLGGEVPHKMFVVPNSDLVKVRYLMVYTKQKATLEPQMLDEHDSRLIVWLNRHKITVCLLAYGLMLVSVGLTRSPTMLRYWRTFCHSLGLYY